MRKKYNLTLPSFTKSKDGIPEFFNVIAYLDKQSALNLVDNGYNVNHITNSSSYTVPEVYPGDKQLLISLFLQDLKRFKFFNSNRYFSYCFLKSNYYGKELSDKEQSLVSKTLNNDNLLIYKNNETYNKNNTVSKPSPKIILLASAGPKIGKSIFSQTLINSLENSVEFSIVDEIRDQLASIFQRMDLSSEIFYPSLYNEIKDTVYTFSEEVDPIIVRNLICDYSDLLQMHLGTHIWGRMVAKKIDSTDSSYIVIDDFRRNIELKYLSEYYGKENIITVYLDKEDVVQPVLSSTANSYEFKIKPEEMDINFKFNSDWSNTNDLIQLIKSKLN